MSSLTNKRIVLGITGSIAAYKSCELIRRLRDEHCDVRVVITKGGEAFITPLTLQALSGNPVHTDLLDTNAEAAMGHIELAKWADVILIAPASADIMARLAAGRGDDLLSTLCLATDAPIAIAPAMNQAMWADEATQANKQALANRGALFFGPNEGSQACGDIGLGRMLEPLELIEKLGCLFSKGELCGKHVVITAGPTREAIDPVRYISNRSSGKMGFALAAACIDAGARVTLIAGPVSLATPERVVRIDIVACEDMLTATLAHIDDCDIFIAAAAVADYKIAAPSEHKLKKSGADLHLTLTPNTDILATVASLVRKPYTVGFAAETNNVETYAREKLKQKNLDMIIANDVSKAGIGFESDDNAVTALVANAKHDFKQTTKSKLARQLVSLIASHLAPI